MSKDREQNLGRRPARGGQQLSNLEKYAKAVEQQAAIMGIIDLHMEGMPANVAGDLLQGVAEGREDEVLQTIARVGQKFIKK